VATLWFLQITFVLATYVVLDGFDLGVGILALTLPRSDVDRHALIDTIRPVWDGNEVWLIAAAGALFFAFPLVYASSFSGFYLPLTIVLWLLVARAFGIELGEHIREPLWRPLFDVAFTGASILLAFFFGVAAGNVVRGVPLAGDGYFFEPLWTNFAPGPHPGVLDWYTVLIGLLSLAVLTVHGAYFVAVKTTGDLQARARAVGRAGWYAVVAMTVVSLVATLRVRPGVLDNYRMHPWGWSIPAVVAVALVAMRYYAAIGRPRRAFAGSAVYVTAMIGGAAFALYPALLPSSADPRDSLTIYNGQTGAYSLRVGLVWWAIGISLAVAYFAVLYRSFRGTVVRD
jgi:cytochrome d ubiquinol oxidase subunit II